LLETLAQGFANEAPFAIVWRRDNVSALLAKFVVDVQFLSEVKAFAKR